VIRTILKRPLAWAAVAVAVAMGLVMTASYLGAFLNPTGNMRALPIAIVSEDAGAAVAGQSSRLGDEVVARVTSPSGPLGDSVRWSVLGSRADAVDALARGAYYGAVVIPADYTARLASLLDPAAVAAQTAAPATIEILTNPAAGAFAGADAQQISLAVVSSVSTEASARIMAVLGAAGVQMPAQMAGVLAEPVQPRVTVAQPVGDTGGRGLAPFYFVLMLTLAAFVAANVVDLSVRFLVGATEFELLGLRFRRARVEASAGRLWAAKLLLVAVSAVGIGAAQTALAVGPFAMTVSGGAALGAFSVLGAIAIGTLTLLLLTAFGEVGALLGVLVTTIFGVPSAGGVYPLQMTPELFRVLGDWLPLRYLADGARSIAFYGGRFDAGLGTAILVLGAYAVASIVLGRLVAELAQRVRERGVRRAVRLSPPDGPAIPA
jgi:YhgE/Pip-like protein